MLCSQKYDLNWGLQQSREVWTKNFKTSAAEEEDAEEEVKKNLISGAMEMYIPPNILHYLLDREIDEEELVNFLMKLYLLLFFLHL